MKKFEYMRPETLEGAAEEIKNGGVAWQEEVTSWAA